MKEPCPICSHFEADIDIKNYNNYDLYKCNNCTCVYCVPFKGPDYDFYANANDLASNERHFTMFPWYINHPTQHSDFLKDGKSKTLLDIGCGNGAFVEFADQKNFNAIGIDLDTKSLYLARKRKVVRAKFYENTLVDFHKANPEAKFDIISMFEVFEHLDNPKETLDLIYKLLKPEGLFIGTLPNENRFFSKNINMDFAKPPYHLTYWTTTSWKNLLETKFCFKTLQCENIVYYGYVSNIIKNKLLENLELLNKNKNIYNFFIRSLFYMTSLIERPTEYLLKNGSSFYFEMRKM